MGNQQSSHHRINRDWELPPEDPVLRRFLEPGHQDAAGAAPGIQCDQCINRRRQCNGTLPCVNCAARGPCTYDQTPDAQPAHVRIPQRPQWHSHDDPRNDGDVMAGLNGNQDVPAGFARAADGTYVRIFPDPPGVWYLPGRFPCVYRDLLGCPGGSKLRNGACYGCINSGRLGPADQELRIQHYDSGFYRCKYARTGCAGNGWAFLPNDACEACINAGRRRPREWVGEPVGAGDRTCNCDRNWRHPG
ncbi:hypothetical protein H2201_006510 [Coniosporium apollinis]|uniref:Zn(2)-C6 fungal-type domain-containing protein n=1 Tax=Coniosporium apollinis TaxID=61459 RepID=A0ABQ9NM31_9PEZI|nr:hypothetical protein H2201_006510 [Coniosporium apollinis]